MCDFDDFDDDFGDDFVDDFSDNFRDGIEDEARDECEGFWDLDTADFAIIGGVIGYLEEEIEERKRLKREMEKEQDCADESCDCDICNPRDDYPYP